tara:strand:+ start:1585 stop:3552 length:1968 start_codon:yes stop_codon:yes gene_type:complete
MANNKNLILKNAIEVGGSTKVTIGDAPASGSVTVGYDLSSASYDTGKSFSVGSQEANPFGVTFSTDGTKVYIVGITSDTIYQYSLSTAFDISTANSTPVASRSLTGEETQPRAIVFKPDGTKMFISGSGTQGMLIEYILSTAWDVSSAAYERGTSVNAQESYPMGLRIKPDGTKLYITGIANGKAHQYSLSTAWDTNSISYDSVEFSFSSQSTDPYDILFNALGTKMFMLGANVDTVFEYNLSTAWDISTSVYSDISFSVTGQDATPYGLSFNNNGMKMYVIGGTTDSIYQYTSADTTVINTFDLSTGNYFATTPSVNAQYDFSNAGDTQTWQLEVTGNQAVTGYGDASLWAYANKSFSVTSQETDPAGFSFKSDGTKMYLIGRTNDTVYQYSLSTAWDVSTSSYDSVSFLASAQVTNPACLIFKPDGTKMYILDYGNDDLFQYSLSTAWNVSTASYDSVLLDPSAQETTPRDFRFNADGTKIFLVGSSSDKVHQYSLTTAYNVGTASYDSVFFSTTGQTTFPAGVDFNADASKMYIFNNYNGIVYQYSLPSAYDIANATYDSVSFTVTQDTNYSRMRFSDDGTSLYVAGTGNDTVYQYTTSASTGITITWDADIQWAGGKAPDSPAANEKDLYTIATDDGGTSYVGIQSGDNFS